MITKKVNWSSERINRLNDYGSCYRICDAKNKEHENQLKEQLQSLKIFINNTQYSKVVILDALVCAQQEFYTIKTSDENSDVYVASYQPNRDQFARYMMIERTLAPRGCWKLCAAMPCCKERSDDNFTMKCQAFMAKKIADRLELIQLHRQDMKEEIIELGILTTDDKFIDFIPENNEALDRLNQFYSLSKLKR